MSELKIVNYVDRKKTLYLAEVFQSVDVKFSLLNSRFEEVTMPAKCRDFLVDCVWSRYHGKTFSIWGFKYDFEEDPFDTEVVRICMRFPNLRTYDWFVRNWKKTELLLNSATLTHDSVYQGDRDRRIIVVHVNSIWATDGWKISLLSSILKLSCYKSFDEAKSPDIDRWNKIKDFLPILLSMVNYPTKFSFYMDGDNSHIHNYGGIISQRDSVVKLFKELMEK